MIQTGDYRHRPPTRVDIALEMLDNAYEQTRSKLFKRVELPTPLASVLAGGRDVALINDYLKNINLIITRLQSWGIEIDLMPQVKLADLGWTVEHEGNLHKVSQPTLLLTHQAIDTLALHTRLDILDADEDDRDGEQLCMIVAGFTVAATNIIDRAFPA